MEERLIRTLTQNNTFAIRAVYEEHREVFLNFGKKYSLDKDELVDIYQDAFVILRSQAIKGKLVTVSSSMRTYLFGIGKNLIFNELKRKKKLVPLQSPSEDTYATISLEKNQDLTEEQKLLQLNFRKIGKKCQEMLTMFYYRGLTIEEITEQGGYNNEGVVRSQKSRCLKTLKELIKSPSL